MKSGLLAWARVCIRGGDQRFGGRAGVAGALFGVACAEIKKIDNFNLDWMSNLTLKKKPFSLQKTRVWRKKENSDCAALMAIAKNRFNQCYNPEYKLDVHCSLQQEPRY